MLLPGVPIPRGSRWLTGEEKQAGLELSRSSRGLPRAAPIDIHTGFPRVWAHRAERGTGCGERSNGFYPCLSAELAILFIKNITSAFDFGGGGDHYVLQ